MTNWLVFWTHHVSEHTQVFVYKKLKNYLTADDRVKVGDFAYLLGGNEGLYGWGYIIRVDPPTSENKMFCEVSPIKIRPNIVSIDVVRSDEKISNLFFGNVGNFVELQNDEVNSLNRLIRQNGTQSPDDLPEIIEQLGNFGIRDTGTLSKKIANAVSEYSLVSLLFLDLDNFKSVNDNFNHSVGDQVISEALRIIESTLKSGELFHRSGDEMIVLLPNVDNSAAMVQAEEIRTAIERMDFPHIGEGVVTTTIGVATYPGNCCDFEILETVADEIAMRTKKKSKNCVANC